MSSSLPRKRPASPTRSGRSHDPPSKRRASQACLSCRNRKVRCNVVGGGMPCTNCRLDNVACEVKETQRGRKAGPARTSAQTDSPGSADARQRLRNGQEEEEGDEGDEEQERGDAEGESEVDEGSVIYCQPRTTQTAPEQVRSLELSQQHPAEAELVEELEGNVSRLHSLPLSPLSVSSNRFRPGSQKDDSRPLVPPENSQPRLPRYIKPIPKHLDIQDVEYLEAKHCLDIPDDELRDELLRVYISYVYPLIPAINVDDLVEAIMSYDGESPLSLLLFQSIMFVAVAFVDTELLLARGYSSHKAARQDFFNRVRILYSLNYERDRLALTQSLLAMTYWYDAPDDDKDTWYWMGIALTTAQVSGFHRDPGTAASPHEVPEARLQRRIWWCCLLRDRFLALGLRRPPRIRDDDYTVSMLSEADFDIGPPSPALIALFRSSKFSCPDAYSRRELAFMNIELCRLSLIAERMLYSQYTSVGAYYGGSEYLAIGTHQPKRTIAQIAALAECAVELSNWIQHLNNHAPYTPGAEPPPDSNESMAGFETRKENVARFHRIQLHMLYLATLGALRRPTVFCQGTNQNDTNGQRAPLTEVEGDPAIQMVKLAFDLQRNHQLQYLTTLAVPTFLAVALVHLLDSRQTDEEARNLSLGRLYQAVYVLEKLQSIYSSADYAVSFLKSILTNAKLNVPLLSMDDGTIDRRYKAPTAKPSMDMGPDYVAAACMYPSPSASAQLNKTMNSSPLLPSPPIATVDEWELPWRSEPVGASLPLHELVAGSPFLTSWFDTEGMMPAMAHMENSGMNFDGSTPMPYF